MSQRYFLRLLGTIGIAAAFAGPALAQQSAARPDLSGTWQLSQDSTKDGLGARAQGLLILSAGNFALQVVDGQLPAFQSDDRHGAAAAEAEKAAKADVAYFGTYDVAPADGSLMFHIASSSFPNWAGSDQKWFVKAAGDQLTLIDTKDSAAMLIWKRVPSREGEPFATRGGRRSVHY
jgi:hypothetical protein